MKLSWKHFLEGMGSIYDIDPTFKRPYEDENGKPIPIEQSLYEIWQAVGQYLSDAEHNYRGYLSDEQIEQLNNHSKKKKTSS